jgi:mannose-1-phosphate guanylyltransferase
VLSALVLCAGLGTRLDPLTRLVAKAVVPLGSRTLVEHVLAWLRAQGVDDVVINLHHRPETIAAVLGDGRQYGLRLRYSWEHPLLGSAGGPRLALPLLDTDPFLIVNGDTLCEPDLAPMVDAHVKRGAAVTMALVPNPAPDRYNGVVLDENDVIVAFVPRGPQAIGSWHFVGIQIAGRAVFEGLEDGVPAETVSGIYRDWIGAGRRDLHGWRVASRFLDVGTPAEYLAAARALDAADATGSVIWPGTRVSVGATVERAIVAGIDVLPDMSVREAVVVPAAILRESDQATRHGDVAVFPIGVT